MNKIDLLIGFVIGIIACMIGVYLFIILFTDYDFTTGFNLMKSQGHFGKLVTLGSILDLIIFGILLKLNKEIMARGIIIAVISITIITLLF